MTDLNSTLLAELARPFTPAAIRFKVQTATQDKTKGLASFYIDARLAAERLNEVVGVENWTDEYRMLAVGMEGAGMFFPVECQLTVCGVTKTDVGQYAHNAPDDKAFKSAYSDALKRAAVKFRIGAYLYTLPSLWAPVKVGGNGKVNGFAPEGEAQLRGQYERWLRTPANRFGEPFDHGDVLEDQQGSPAADGESRVEQGAVEAHPSTPPAPTPTDGEFRFTSGKHSGKTLGETDPGYLDWYLEKGPRDDVKAAIRAFRGEDEDMPWPGDESEVPF